MSKSEYQNLEEWLRSEFDLSVEELKDLCEWNYGLMDTEDEGFSIPWRHDGLIWSIFYDDCGMDYFDTFEEAVNFYGEDFVEKYLQGLVRYAEYWGGVLEEIKGKHRQKKKLGFFENLTDKKFGMIANDLIKRVIIKVVQEGGYQAGGYGYHNNNGTSYRTSPTVAEIVHILDSVEDLESVACSPELFIQINEWVENLEPSGPYADYQRKGKEVWEKNHLVRADLPLVASFCNGYFKELAYQERQRAKQERERAHQEYVDSDANSWAGEVGQEIEFTIAEAKINGYIHPHSYYASSYPVWTIKDDIGRTYSWGDTKQEIELKPGMRVKAKIKRLNEYRGVKQTQIWKLVITHDGKKLGFFN